MTETPVESRSVRLIVLSGLCLGVRWGVPDEPDLITGEAWRAKSGKGELRKKPPQGDSHHSTSPQNRHVATMKP